MKTLERWSHVGFREENYQKYFISEDRHTRHDTRMMSHFKYKIIYFTYEIFI
jgi:hypothetical protein